MKFQKCYSMSPLKGPARSQQGGHRGCWVTTLEMSLMKPRDGPSVNQHPIHGEALMDTYPGEGLKSFQAQEANNGLQ